MLLFKLKQTAKGTWYVYAPKGHLLTGPFYGHKFKAIEWAKNYISTWPNSYLDIDEI